MLNSENLDMQRAARGCSNGLQVIGGGKIVFGRLDDKNNLGGGNKFLWGKVT